MTKITYIPGEIANAAIDENGNRKPVTRTQHIFDDAKGKSQAEVNSDVDEEIAEIKGGSTETIATLNQKIATEQGRAQGAEQGLDNRLSTVEELAEISVGGGDIGIATADDFESDNPSDLAKVPTVGAILGGANDGVYDISARHNGTKYTDLAAALGTNGANVPDSLKRGGMFVKFERSDNKYVHYNLLATQFTTDITQWAIADNGIYIDNSEYIYVETDRNGKIFFAVKKDGDVVFGIGVPNKIKKYVLKNKEEILAIVSTKVNKESGKSLINTLFAESIDYVDNSEFYEVETDINGKIISAIKKNGEGIVGGININRLQKEVKNQKNKISSLNNRINTVDSRINTVDTKNNDRATTFVNKLQGTWYSNITIPIGWNDYGYYGLGRLIASRKLGLQLASPIVNEKMNPKDALPNSAGWCLYDNGYVYVLKCQNHLASGNGEPEYVNICKIDITNNAIVNRATLFDVDTDLVLLDGTTFHCGRAYQGSWVIINDYIKVIAPLSTLSELDVDASNTVICATVNKNTFDVVSYEKCQFKNQNIVNDWVTDRRLDPFMDAGISYCDGYYYTISPLPNSFNWSIIKSSDCITWEYVTRIPAEVPTFGEFGIDCNNGICHIAVRGKNISDAGVYTPYCSNAVILKYKMSDWSLIKSAKIESGASMHSFFRCDGNLYLLLCGAYSNRRYYKIVKINEQILESSYIVADTNDNFFGANTIIAVDDSNNLYGCLTNLNLQLCKFNIPTFTQIEANKIIDYLMQIV